MNFGDLYKKKIEQQQFGDAERHWKELEQRLDAAMPVAKKKRGFFWMFFAAVTVLSIGVAMYLNTSKQSEVNTVALNQSITEQIQQQSNHVLATSKAIITSPDEAIISQTNNQTSLTASISQAEINRTATLNTTEKQPIKQQIKAKNTFKQTSSVNPVVQANKQLNSSENEVENNENKYAEKSYVEHKATANRSKLETDLQPKNGVESAAIDASDILEINKNVELTKLDLASAFQIIQLPTIDMSASINPTHIVEGINDNVSNAKVDSLNTKKNVDPVKDYAKKSKSKFFSMGVYGGSMYSMKHLYNFISSNSNHQTRNNSELSNTWSYQAGAEVNYHIGKFIISTGINYHSQNQTRNFENAFYRDIETDSILTTINEKNYWITNVDSFSTIHINSSWVSTPTSVNYYDGTTGGYTSNELASSTYVVDTHTVYHHLYDSVYVPSDTIYTNVKFSNIKKMRISTIKNLTGTNYIRYIEIPLMVGYNFQFNRLAIMVRSGIGFGIFSKQSNYFINSTETNLVASKNDDFRKLIYNYLLRVGVNYMISPKLGIAVEPIIRANLNSVFSNKNEFQQRFRNYGANLGITYKF